MLRRIIVAGLVLAMLVPAFCQSAVSVPNVTISPGSFTFSGGKGDIVTKTATLTNHGSATVSFNITSNMTGLTIVPSRVTVTTSTPVNFMLVYILPANISSGSITFAWNGSELRVVITYIVVGSGENQAPVEIFPSTPVSGADIVIFFKETTPGLVAKGFLSVNSFIYPVIIDGFTIISLDKNAYGTALLYLFGNSVMPKDSKKTFTIQKGSIKEVVISVSKDVVINSDVTVTVMYGGDFLNNQEVIIIDPDDDQETMTTDNRGRIEFRVDSVGKWRLRTVADGQLATANINVDYGKLSLGIVEEEYGFGDTVTVITEPETAIDIYINNAYEGRLAASSEGFFSLVLSRGGTYRLEGSLGNLKGEYVFSIPGQAQIRILDPVTASPVTKLQVNKRYTVSVTDTEGGALKGADSIWISNPSGAKELLPLTDGAGGWCPLALGPYTLTFDDTATTAGNSMYFLIKPAEADFGPTLAVATVTVFFMSLFIILALVARSKAVPMTYLLSSLFKKKQKIELPIDD